VMDCTGAATAATGSFVQLKRWERIADSSKRFDQGRQIVKVVRSSHFARSSVDKSQLNGLNCYEVSGY